jgi:lysozyme|tara:strand:+ start:2038 stop:2523 length:486 start_codon:yes stop_codon:yes gene_type:complete
MTVDVKELYQEISSDEGKILHAYLCTELHATVGIGHKILDTDPEKELEIYGVNWEEVPDDQCITEHRCYVLFQEDVQIAIGGCMNIYSNWDELPQEMQHVLVNMAFQMGQRGLSNFKNMKAAIEEQDFAKTAVEMMDSRWASQTPERAERLKLRVERLAGK